MRRRSVVAAPVHTCHVAVHLPVAAAFCVLLVYVDEACLPDFFPHFFHTLLEQVAEMEHGILPGPPLPYGQSHPVLYMTVLLHKRQPVLLLEVWKLVLLAVIGRKARYDVIAQFCVPINPRVRHGGQGWQGCCSSGVLGQGAEERNGWNPSSFSLEGIYRCYSSLKAVYDII